MKKGFTLIELLVVIAVIGMLSSIVLVSLKGTNYKAKMAKAESFSSQIAHVLRNEAVGIWSFDDAASGTALDSSGYGNNGTVVGATPVADRKGQSNKAYSFNGISDYVELGNPLLFNSNFPELSVEAWFESNVWSSTDYSMDVLVSK